MLLLLGVAFVCGFAACLVWVLCSVRHDVPRVGDASQWEDV